jgi:hypothetical protein
MQGTGLIRLRIEFIGSPCEYGIEPPGFTSHGVISNKFSKMISLGLEEVTSGQRSQGCSRVCSIELSGSAEPVRMNFVELIRNPCRETLSGDT